VLTGRSPYLPVIGQPPTLRGTTVAMRFDLERRPEATATDELE